MDNVELRFKTVISQPFAENTFIVWADGCQQCLLVDPGMDPDATAAAVASLELTPVGILNTHGHADHIAGNDASKAAWPDAPLIIGHGDRPMLTDPQQNLSAPFGLPLISPDADQVVFEGDVLELANLSLLVRETPGHSQGHVIFVVQNSVPMVILGGDMLMRGSVGRSDFPGGSTRDLIHSIHHKMFTLPDETVVLPGHGPETTIGEEKESNPFVGRRA